ncbi:uncharacterized protein CC84DRAFT_1237448 [Paraphaeosphaeria sporulosa]|uniref:Uncharacterized protein n=1 Tax=Paraphaeosphaeria sporulosa TaxID=1460663 RepID=A0A177CSS9_9PLEO|nr:uncharacterized protein CC84DRAFT_1237448 [Paraphaeosphaeria sporulosa]OAG10594.1 hypothetical protein CC84DRAFT_1237448 [Paraphaeosphaeria sporulosa]
MGRISNPKHSNGPNLAMDSFQLARNASLAIRVALGSDWNSPGGALSTVADKYILKRLDKAISSADDEQPDWEAYILIPLFNSCLSTYTAIDIDSKFVTQTVAVILLAYDIIRQRNAVPTQTDYNFIESTLDKFLTPESLVIIREVVEAESERYSGLNIDFGKVNGLFVLEALLKEAIHRAENNGIVPEGATVKLMADSVKTQVPTASADEGFSSTPGLQTTTKRDVHLQYYLKSGYALEVDSVTSIDLHNEALVLETSDGLHVSIEEGVIVSEVEGKSRTVDIRAPQADGFELSATVVIPPDNSYIIEDVTSVERIDKMADWAVFETLKATIWVGNGAYMYERDGETVKVKNLFNICSTA